MLNFRGDFAAGIARLEELLDLVETIPEEASDRRKIEFQVLDSLSLVALRYGDYAYSLRATKRKIALMPRRSRWEQIGDHLDLGLAMSFAGLFDQAIEHEQAGLRISIEIGSEVDIGLLSANLCLACRQSGKPEQALTYGREAIEVLQKVQQTRMEGQARNRTGHALLALGNWSEAERTYAQALDLWQALPHPNRLEAVAGQGVALLHLGRREEAAELAEVVEAFVNAKGLLGIVEPAWLLLNCYRIFEALGQNDQSEWALQRAASWVETIAARISDDELRAAFYGRLDNRLVLRNIRG